MGYTERPGNRPLRALTIMQTRHTRKLVSLSLGLTVLACVWYFLAPVALGGSTSYVVTDGISMEPHFHTGDLAVIRSQSSYRVGEIVAYRSKMFHTVVLHRIIARDGSRYVFKGDNNNFVDFEHPAAGQLIGSLWLHVPGLGGKLQSVRSPALIALLVTIGVLLLSGVAFTHRRRRRRRQRRAESEGAPDPARRLAQRSSEQMVGVLTWGLVALLPLVGLALLAFTRPTTTSVPYSVPYQQSGAFSYSADASPGPAYANNHAATGDPLFTHLIKSVDVSFEYLFQAKAEHSLKGRVWMDAEMASSSGWHTTLVLARPASFHGDRARVTADLDLTSLLALLHRVSSTTEVNGSYTLALVPHVSTAGSIGTAPIHTTYSPQLHFSLGELEVQPTLGASTTPLGKPLPSPFAPTEAGSVAGRHAQPVLLSLGFAHPSVGTARGIALGGIAILICTLMATVAFVRPRRRGEAAAIKERYGGLIVPVARVWQLPGAPVIDVDDMESLVRIAEHYDRSILHETADGEEAFWVTDESGQFRFSVGAARYEESAEADYAQAAVEAVSDVEVPYSEPVTAVVFAEDYMAGANGYPAETPYMEAADYSVQAPYVEATTSHGYREEDPYVEPVDYSVQAPYVEPVVEPVYVAVAQPVVEPVYAAVAQPVIEPVYAAVSQPVVDPSYAVRSHYVEAVVPDAQRAPAVGLDAEGRPDTLVREVYADELELGGVISAFDAQAAPEPAPAATEPTPVGDELGETLIEGWRAAYEVAQAGRPVVVKS